MTRGPSRSRPPPRARPRPDHGARRDRVAAAVRDEGLAGLWVTGASNVRYLCGFTGSSGSLLVRADGGRHVLATDGRYRTQARVEVDGLGESVDLRITRDDDWLVAVTGELSAGTGPGEAVLGIEAEHMSLARGSAVAEQLPGGALRALTGTVEALRTCKDAAELAALADAAAVTVAAFGAMWTWLAPGLTERAVAHRLLGEMLERGAAGAAFDFIVAAGPGGGEPHHGPTDYRIRRGDLVTVDAGAVVGGYRADMTRTVAVGPPAPVLRDVYEVVARAQARGVGACREQRPAGEVDAACRQVVAAAGHGDHFPHPTGHGVGLDVHEPPILHAGQAATLRRGMAVTVEPGIYLPGVGGVRIEDVVAVTDHGPRVLTSDSLLTAPTTHDLLVV